MCPNSVDNDTSEWCTVDLPNDDDDDDGDDGDGDGHHHELDVLFHAYVDDAIKSLIASTVVAQLVASEWSPKSAAYD